MSKPTVTELDLTREEQEHVRNALHFLRVKLGGWRYLTKLLHFEEMTLIQSGNGTRTVTASMAFRIARVVGVPVDDLIHGKFPEAGTCPRCGYKVPVDGKFATTKETAHGKSKAAVGKGKGAVT